MLTKSVDISQAQTNFAELLSMVTAGTEIILTRGNTPVAHIVPIVGSTAPRVAGLRPGSIWISEDFAEPLPEEFWAGEA